jgi:hydroxymethylglutaryl-CoA lyase
MEAVNLIECPRDAWQGLEKIIPTATKAQYLRKLVEWGFGHLDAVSFVAPKYVPQMADSEEVLRRLIEAGIVPPRVNGSAPADASAASVAGASRHLPPLEVIGIVVNEPGIERALHAPGVTTLGYPYSISAHFRRQNANMSLAESRRLVERLRQATRAAHRDLVVYISMAFGNPFDEPWGPELVSETLEWLRRRGVEAISLADTVGVATPKEVGDLYQAVSSAARGAELGVHLHSRPESAAEKVLAAYEAGCRRFDSALTGLGGCSFAGDELVGNLPTEIVVGALGARGAVTGIEPSALAAAVEATKEIRKQYAP